MATEQAVQTAVWQLELGRGKIVLRWAVVVLAAIAMSLVYTANQFRGLEKREAMDAAQLARNIARGEGFTTSVIRPVALWHLKTYRADHRPMFENHPDTYNAPLYPWVLGMVFRLMPPAIFEGKMTEPLYPAERWAIVPFNQICLLLTVLLVYFWAKQLFDQRVAVMAGLLLLFSNTLWSYSISGLSTNLLMLLLLGSVYCLFLADRRLNPPDAAEPGKLDPIVMALVAASAVLLGLCFLTRYLTIVLILPLAIYAARIFRGRRSLMWAGLFVAIALAVIAPWLARNVAVANSLLGTARYQFFSTELFERTYNVDLKEAWTLKLVAGRFMANLQRIWVEDFRLMGTDLLVFFFVAGILYTFRRPDTTRLRRIVLGCLVALLLGMAFVGLPYEPVTPEVNGGKLFILLLPVVAMFGVAFFYLLLDRIPFRMQLTRNAAIGAFALVNVAPIVLTILPPSRGHFPYPPYCQPYYQLVASWYQASDVGVSDAPWAVAWYADRRTLWLPATIEEYYNIHDFVAPNNTQFMLLTPYMLDRPLQSSMLNGEFKPWVPITRGLLPDKFPLRAATALPPGTDQILISDRARWRGAEEVDEAREAVKEATK